MVRPIVKKSVGENRPANQSSPSPVGGHPPANQANGALPVVKQDTWPDGKVSVRIVYWM